jgi:hypothetical protein
VLPPTVARRIAGGVYELRGWLEGIALALKRFFTKFLPSAPGALDGGLVTTE